MRNNAHTLYDKSVMQAVFKKSSDYQSDETKDILGLPTSKAIGALPITGEVTGLQVILNVYAG